MYFVYFLILLPAHYSLNLFYKQDLHILRNFNGQLIDFRKNNAMCFPLFCSDKIHLFIMVLLQAKTLSLYTGGIDSEKHEERRKRKE